MREMRNRPTYDIVVENLKRHTELDAGLYGKIILKLISEIWCDDVD
jgi:hypothetical protein